MTDIVARVRDACFIGLVPKDKAEIFLEAADEIERLRKENKELKDARIDLHTVDNIVGSVQDLLLAARRQYDTHLIQKDLIASKDDEIERLRAKVVHLSAARAEIERLRQLGDTMAYFVRSGDGKEMYSAVYVWEEARRG